MKLRWTRIENSFGGYQWLHLNQNLEQMLLQPWPTLVISKDYQGLSINNNEIQYKWYFSIGTFILPLGKNKPNFWVLKK